MSASQQIRYYHGSSPGTAGGDVTGSVVRHKLADNDIVDTNNPISLPLSGLSFGWRKSSKENWTGPPVGAISDLVWFLTGSFATGQYVYARVQSVGIYVQASSADQLGIAGFTDTAPNRTTNLASQYTSGSPLTINAGTVLSNPNTGEGDQNFLETQMAIDSTYGGGAGPINPLTVTMRYTET